MSSRNHGESLLTRAYQITGEQTNTSIVLPNLIMAGAPNGVITKVLRYPAPVPHPDVEVPQALHRVGYHGVPKALGFTTAALPDGEIVTTSITSELIPDAEDGFELACAYARNNKSFAPHAEKLGETIAQLHNALAEAFPVTTMKSPAEFIDQFRSRANNAIHTVPELLKYVSFISEQYDQVESYLKNPKLQHIHGDLHLGQTLYQSNTDKWYVLDFEGEPLRPAAERNKPDFPERDVAGMARSFSYAAAVAASDPVVSRRSKAAPQPTGAENDGLTWEQQATASFLKGYQKQRSIDNIVLAALTLDKALYEAVYEHQHRPAWLHIPIAAIAELLGENRVS